MAQPREPFVCRWGRFAQVHCLQGFPALNRFARRRMSGGGTLSHVRETGKQAARAGRMARCVRPVGPGPYAYWPGGASGRCQRSGVPDPLHWLRSAPPVIGTRSIRAREPAVVMPRVPGERDRGFSGCPVDRAGAPAKSRTRLRRPGCRTTLPGLVPFQSVAGTCAAPRLSLDPVSDQSSPVASACEITAVAYRAIVDRR